MPFYERFDERTGEPIVDRTQTGPPAPSPSTGTVRAEDGSIVADSATITIPPATPVRVDQPSPFEPVIDSEGRISPRWWRFFDQLYRRTGGVVDNINRVPTRLLGAGSVDALALTGAAPSAEIDEIVVMSVGSMTATGLTAQPAHSNPIEAPGTGSMTISGETPIRVPGP